MKPLKIMKKLAALSMAAVMSASAFGAVNVTAAGNGYISPEPERAIAFPGAEGAGKFATGGRGGEIYHVTNLNDSGTGSLRDAVSSGRRIVVFDVGGTINLKSDISISGNISVMGQTAPGGAGITVRNGKLAMAGDNIIVRYVSSRPGEKGSGDYDAWGGSKGSNSIIDHCSIGWANDEQYGLYSGKNMTLQYTIIGPANCLSTHSKGTHGFGPMFGAANNSWHHNLICHNMSRNFRGKVDGSNAMDYVNNVIYDWGGQTAYGTFGHENYVGNYFKKGISTRGGDNFGALDSGSNYNVTKFFLEGNKMTDRKGSANSTMSNNNWNGGLSLNRNLNYYESHYRASQHFPILVSGVDVSVAQDYETADQAFEHVTSYAGAAINKESRTRIDDEVLNDAINGTGSLSGGGSTSSVSSDVISKYSIKQVNYDEYYPEAILTKEITDSDNDGMPDDWETARGLNPNDPSDASGCYLGGAYTNIEHYCNDLTVDSFPDGVVTLSPTLEELGDDYSKAIADLNALKLSKSKISDASDLTLATTGFKNGSDISWSSSSDNITIENNQVTSVTQPTGTSNETAYLKAEVSYGGCTLTKYFTPTVLTSTFSWYPSESDNGKAAGTKLAEGLYTVSDIVTGTLSSGITVDGSSRTTYMTYTENGSYSNGAGTGICLKYTAPYDGTLYGYAAELADTKTFYIVPEGVKDYKTEYAGMKVGGSTLTTVSAKVTAGTTYYIFPAGTKGKVLGMKFVKKTATQSTTKTETDMETWDFDDLAVGTTFARDDKITNSNGASLVLDVRDGDSITVANRSGSDNSLQFEDKASNRAKWTYTPEAALSGDKVVFQFEYNKGDIEKDTTLIRVYDEVNASCANTYSGGSIIFALNTSSNKGEKNSTSSELVLTDYFSQGTGSTGDSEKGVDFGFSNFTYSKDTWYGIRLELFKNENGKNEVALYTKTESSSKYTYRDSVILGSGIQKSGANVDDINLTPTKAELMTPGSGPVSLGIDNISIGVENTVSTIDPTPEPTPQGFVFSQGGSAVQTFDGGELTCEMTDAVTGDYVMTVAEYGADDALINTHDAENSSSVTITPDTETAVIRAFIWSDYEGMVPLKASGEIKRK